MEYSTPEKKLFRASEALETFYGTNRTLDRLNKSQLNEITGFAHQTITKRLESANVTPDDKGYFNSKQALAAILVLDDVDNNEQDSGDNDESIQQDPGSNDYEFYRTQLVKAKAQREQLELEKEQGKYILKNEIYSQLSSLMKTIRTRFDGVGSRVSQAVTPHDTPSDIGARIDNEVLDILEDLSKGNM